MKKPIDSRDWYGRQMDKNLLLVKKLTRALRRTNKRMRKLLSKPLVDESILKLLRRFDHAPTRT